MTKKEWDTAFMWMLVIFPNWKVTIDTSIVWYEEIGHELSLEKFKLAFRNAVKKTGYNFAPSVFQVLAEIEPKEDLELQAQEAWRLALYNNQSKMDSVTLRAFRALNSPSNLSLMQNEEVKWVEKKFIKLWVACKESEQHDEVLQQLENPDLNQLVGKLALVKKIGAR